MDEPFDSPACRVLLVQGEERAEWTGSGGYSEGIRRLHWEVVLVLVA